MSLNSNDNSVLKSLLKVLIAFVKFRNLISVFYLKKRHGLKKNQLPKLIL